MTSQRRKGSRKSTSSRRGSPANRSRSPAEGKEQRTSAGSGQTPRGSFAWWDRDGSCWRTFQASLLGGCQKFSEGFPRSGTMRSGRLYPRRHLVPRIFASESGLWPTPNVHEEEAERRYSRKTSFRHFEEGRQIHLSQAARDQRMWPTPRASNPGSRIESEGGKILAQEVEMEEGVRDRRGRKKRWPTPRAADGGQGQWKTREQAEASGYSEMLSSAVLGLKHGKPRRGPGHVPMWPTPTKSDAEGGPGRSEKRRGGDNLRTSVKMWPTPTASVGDWGKGEGLIDPKSTHDTIKALVERDPSMIGGQLNPTWVEWLMGYPLGWTDSGL